MLNEITQTYRYICDNCKQKFSLRNVNFVKSLTLVASIQLNDDDEYTGARAGGLDKHLDIFKEYIRSEFEKRIYNDPYTDKRAFSKEGESVLCNTCYEDLKPLKEFHKRLYTKK